MDSLEARFCVECKIEKLSTKEKRQEVGRCVVNLLLQPELSETNYVEHLISGNTGDYHVGDPRLEAYVLCADAHTLALPKTTTESVSLKICPLLRSTIVVG